MPMMTLADEYDYVNYFGVGMSKEQYNNLLELGFSESEITYMSEEEFNANKDVVGKLEADVTNYYVNVVRYDITGKIVSSSDMQISKEDYMNSDNLLMPLGDGLVGTSYKEMRTTIAKADSKYRYKVNLKWKTMPATRSYDIIGIGFEPNVYLNSDINFQQKYCSLNICKTNTAINSSSVNPNGVGVSFLLPSSKEITSMESTLYFDVSKVISGTIKLMTAYGDYSHATKKIAGGAAQMFAVNQAGVDLSTTIEDYYDAIDSAAATWSGTW